MWSGEAMAMPWCCVVSAIVRCRRARSMSVGRRRSASAGSRKRSGNGWANFRSSRASKRPTLGSSTPARRCASSAIRACRSPSWWIGPRTGSRAACRVSARTPITMPAMASSEPRLTVKAALTASELDDVGALVRDARWNQLAADWRIFLKLGRVYAIATDDGRIVATTATLPYGGRFAWISMVLVAPDYRRRGLATRLMQQAMRELAAAKLVPVLDATPDGREVYRRLGFEDAWGFQRLIRRERQGAGAPAPAGIIVRPITDADWQAACAYDAAAFAAEPGAVLAGLPRRRPPAALVALRAGELVGFLPGPASSPSPHLRPLTPPAHP